MTDKNIFEKIVDACDDASLNAWATSTYWGDVRPVLVKELADLKEYYDSLIKKLHSSASTG